MTKPTYTPNPSLSEQVQPRILTPEFNLWLGSEDSYRLHVANQALLREMLISQGPTAALLAAQGEEEQERQFSYMTDMVDSLGIITIQGTLTDEYSPWNRYVDLVSYDEIRNAAVELVNNGAKMLLGVYKTPGGSASGISASSEFMQELDAMGIPFYAYSETMMMSGGYWHGVTARKVFTEKMAMNGSIGVITIHFSQKGYLDKMGVIATVMRKGEFKALGTPYENLNEKAREEIEGRMGTIYDMFLDHVGNFRKLSRQHLLDRAAEGRVFMGQQSVEVGLADGVMTYEKVVKYLLDQSPGKPALVSAPKPNYQLSGDNEMKKKRLNQAGLGAVAEGLAPEQALKDPKLTEEVEETPATDPAAPAPAAQTVEEPKPAADPATPAVEEPKPAAAAAPAAVADTTLIDRVIELSTQLATAQMQVKTLTDTVALMKTDESAMRGIVVKSINRMLPALGLSAMAQDDSVPTSYLVSKWGEVNTQFHNQFPGSARAVAVSDSDQNKQKETHTPSVPLSAVSVGTKRNNR